nr:gliding motility-associated C-terminal domain-containing protein [Flavobacteriia bacterium]
TDCFDNDNDNDGVQDNNDAFPLDPSEWSDTDSDGIGNNADTDDDGDGFSDLDELSCDTNPLDAGDTPADLDNDGIPNCLDTDRDGDGCLNTQDVFPDDPTECEDTDGDGMGDNFEVDKDGDGILDVDDAFPLDPNESKDSDADGIGDNADTDDNNDGFDDEKVMASGMLTPNSSGMESTWKIVNIEQYPNARVRVYDINGLEVYNKANYRNDWRGNFKDNESPLPAGSYFYIVNLNGKAKPLKGWMYIIY